MYQRSKQGGGGVAGDRPYPAHIAKPLDNQVEGLPVVAHPAKQEDHFRDQITLVTDIVRLSNTIQHSDIRSTSLS